MKLFEPVTIRGMELRNRVIAAAMAIGVTNLGVEPETQKIIDFYGDLAHGGASAVIIGALSSSFILTDEDLGQFIPPDSYVKALASVIDEVHRHGAKFGVQLMSTNQYPLGANNPSIPSQYWVAPSDSTREIIGLWYVPQQLRALTEAEISSIQSRYARAAVQAKSIGADFVELHMAHGHLVNQFFSPVVNRRTDKYGGSVQARMRFGLECVGAIRLAVGEDYPVFVRLGTVDEREDGIALEDSVLYAKELEKASVDCIDVSVGISTRRKYDNYVSPLKNEKEATFINYAEQIKNAVSVPVITAGRIHRPEIAESILESGKADLVALARQLICDPEWPEKVSGGRENEIIYCSSCNTWCSNRVDLLYQDYREAPGCKRMRK